MGQRVQIRPSLLARGVRCPSCHERLRPRLENAPDPAGLVTATVDPGETDTTLTTDQTPMTTPGMAGATVTTDHQSGSNVSLRTIPGTEPSEDISADTAALRGYRVGDELGRGGLGLVLRAEQRAFGREVAIKRLLPGTSTPKRVRKFRAEAAATAQLEHPHIIPVYDLGRERCRRSADGDETRHRAYLASTSCIRNLTPSKPPRPN